MSQCFEINCDTIGKKAIANIVENRIKLLNLGEKCWTVVFLISLHFVRKTGDSLRLLLFLEPTFCMLCNCSFASSHFFLFRVAAHFPLISPRAHTERNEQTNGLSYTLWFKDRPNQVIFIQAFLIWYHGMKCKFRIPVTKVSTYKIEI